MATVLDAPVTVQQIKPAIGAVVHVDKQTLLDPAFAPRVIELLNQRLALVFPRMNLSDEEQLRFTDNLGDRINFTRTAPGEILYTFIVEDPQLYRQPWKGESVMALSDDRMFEFACHEAITASPTSSPAPGLWSGAQPSKPADHPKLHLPLDTGPAWAA